jgi:uncharacterized protein YPO0396
VILGRFYAEEIDQCVTLAQVFWLREAQGQPERLYVIHQEPLSIGVDFSSFGEIPKLRRRLRAAGAELHESFAGYGAAYRRRLGINDEQAMDLFYQTVSMKSVGNLTDFVREHMLEAFDVEPRIRALVAHFDDLNRAHDAVLRAKDQIERLTPLIFNNDLLAHTTADIERLRACREALRPWFASLKGELLRKRLAQHDADLARCERQIAALIAARRDGDAARNELREAIMRNGGDRIEQIKREIEKLAADRQERQRRCAQYDGLAAALALRAATDEEHFGANRIAVVRERETLDAAQESTQAALTEAAIEEPNCSAMQRTSRASSIRCAGAGRTFPAVCSTSARVCAVRFRSMRAPSRSSVSSSKFAPRLGTGKVPVSASCTTLGFR